MKKYQCPCCGYFTYNVPANEDCGYICPVCFWENDPFIVKLGDKINDPGFWEKLGNFFMDLWDKIRSMFSYKSYKRQ